LQHEDSPLTFMVESISVSILYNTHISLPLFFGGWTEITLRAVRGTLNVILLPVLQLERLGACYICNSALRSDTEDGSTCTKEQFFV